MTPVRFRRIAALLFVGVAACLLGVRVSAGETPRAQRAVGYTIDATYDEIQHSIRGRETIVWRNLTKRAASDLQLHLYLNAFANSESSFLRAAGTRWQDFLDRHPRPWGYAEIEELRVDGVDLTNQITFLHPDDDNPADRTVARVPLPSRILPGEEAKIDIEFVTQLPRAAVRSGHAGPFAMAAQWFPKLGVFQAGAWNCHQYQLTTEFFAEFGSYDVSLTLAGNAIVGATGVLQNERQNSDGSKTLRFYAEDVHDFAWAVDSRFLVIERMVEGVPVRLLLQPQHEQQAERHLEAVAAALRRYQKWFARYPYPQLTLIDPAPGAWGVGGMEYPMLITTGTTWWMPRGLRIPEHVIVHELGHQYWYAVVANNEFEDAWLDEGINSFVEAQLAEDAGLPYLDVFGLKSGMLPLLRFRYLTAARHDPIQNAAWSYLDSDSYTAISYAKTALALETLDRQLGANAVRKALAAYFQAWQFKHPRPQDFFASLERSVGQDLGWFLEPVFRGTDVLDYAVTRVSSEEIGSFAGYRFSGQRVGELSAPAPSDTLQYRNEVVIERLGGVQIPIDVQIGFDDGTVSNQRWDGRSRWKRFEFSGPQRVEWAVVDPQQALVLDINFLNNSRTRATATRGVVRLVGRWAFWFQNLLLFLTAL